MISRFSLLIVTAMVVFVSCTPKDLPTVMSIEGNKVIMKVSHMTTKQEMEDFKSQLNVLNINLDFSKSVFFENGKLRNLFFIVTMPDGTGGSAGADLTKLQFSYFGFISNPNDNTVLKTGSLE